MYRNKRITYEALQQYYADNDILPSYSPYKKKRRWSSIALENYLKTIPDPVKLKRNLKRYREHKLSRLLAKPAEADVTIVNKDVEVPVVKSFINKMKSKSSIKYTDDHVKPPTSVLNARSSKLSFKRSDDILSYLTNDTSKSRTSLKKIPEKYLAPQPIQRPPFQTSRKMPSYCYEDGKGMMNSTGKSELSGYKLTRRKMLNKFMKEIIMEAAMKGIMEETQRERMRLLWASPVQSQIQRNKTKEENCLQVLGEIFESIPDKEEYTDSDLSKTFDFKKLAEDKYNDLKYWGKRLFTLSFESA